MEDEQPLFFAEEPDSKAVAGQDTDVTPWKVLVVDDDEQIHKVTSFVLQSFYFDGVPIEIISAYSGKEGRAVFERHDDIAMALIDVVMETDLAGLELVDYIRNTLSNHATRIVLRTGQPGYAPVHQIIEQYDINDYKEKTELTSQKLKNLLFSVLRSYRDIRTIQRHQDGLRQVLHSTSRVLQSSSMQDFASAVLEDVLALLNLRQSAIYCTTLPEDASQDVRSARILAATGELIEWRRDTTLGSLPQRVQTLFNEALQSKASRYHDDGYVVYSVSNQGHENLLFVETNKRLQSLEMELLEAYCTNVALTYENLLSNEDLQDTQKELVYLLGDAFEHHDCRHGAHVKRVALLTEQLALLYGLDHEYVSLLKHAAPLHDLGKVAVPAEILNKQSKLNEQEWQLVQQHTQFGYDILKDSPRRLLKVAAEIAATHHEHWDGSGYPKGLCGLDIPISGRIVALADVFDSLGHEGCYHAQWNETDIRQYLQKESGKQFDPELVDLLISHYEQMKAIQHLTYQSTGR